MENIRSRNFMAILYPDEDSAHLKAFELSKSNFDCAYILHDKDLKSDPSNEFDFKKPHYHVAYRFNNAISQLSLSKKLGIEPNYLSAWDSYQKMLLYLIHKNNQDKYQYSVDCVGGNLKTILLDVVSKNKYGDLEAFTLIRDYILSFRGYLRWIDLCNFVIKKGLLSQFKSCLRIYEKLVDEHNFYIK